VINFTHFYDKLVFSLNNGTICFMSNGREYTRQPAEIITVTNFLFIQVRAARTTMLRCGVVFLTAFFLLACGHHEATSAGNNASRLLRRGLPGEPRTLDPQLADDDFSFQVLRDLYEGLTAEDASGQIVPGAADSWTLDPTGTVYTFHLRSQAKWSNGERTTASDFVQGLRRAVDPKTASGSAGLLAVIRGATEIIAGKKSVTELAVTAVDESSVQIVLEHPAPFILQILSQPIAAPFHANRDALSDKNYGPFNGAYILLKRVTGSYIDLVRNPQYWNLPKVSIERVRYVNAESEATELREYIAGDLDLTFSIPLPDLDRISRKLRDEIQISPTLGTTYLALNLSKSPLNDNAAIREALSIAVDREQIAKNVMGGVAPAYSFVATGTSGYNPPRYDWVDWSRDRQLAYARSLYLQSGYSDNKPLHLRLYFSNGESIQRVMIAVAGSWKQNLGVISELANDEFRVFLVGRKDRTRWDAARLKWDADYDDPSSFLDVFANDSNQNDPEYKSASFNNLLAQARIEPDSAKRMKLLHNAEQVLLDDYPIIPIYFTRSRRLVKPYVGGAKINPMNRIYSKNLFWQ
jgi:ABC-type oligopeptide transport system substrate-binding subunit